MDDDDEERFSNVLSGKEPITKYKYSESETTTPFFRNILWSP